MIKQSEAEQAIRQLISEWAEQKGFGKAQDNPNFYEFLAWLDQAGFGRYLNFRSTIGARNHVEIWFDSMLKQNWRN